MPKHKVFITTWGDDKCRYSYEQHKNIVKNLNKNLGVSEECQEEIFLNHPEYMTGGTKIYDLSYPSISVELTELYILGWWYIEGYDSKNQGNYMIHLQEI